MVLLYCQRIIIPTQKKNFQTNIYLFLVFANDNIYRCIYFSGQSMVITVSTSMTLPSANCEKVQFHCVIMTIPGSANYLDADDSDGSNTVCTDITNDISCTPSG